MEKKMTKKEMFARLIGLVEDMEVTDREDLLQGLQHEIDLLEKKAEKSKGYKRAKKEDVMKEAIYTCLNKAEFRLTSDIVADIKDEYADVTASKVTARLSALVKEGLVEKQEVSVEKRKLMGYKLIG